MLGLSEGLEIFLGKLFLRLFLRVDASGIELAHVGSLLLVRDLLHWREHLPAVFELCLDNLGLWLGCVPVPLTRGVEAAKDLIKLLRGHLLPRRAVKGVRGGLEIVVVPPCSAWRIVLSLEGLGEFCSRDLTALACLEGPLKLDGDSGLLLDVVVLVRLVSRPCLLGGGGGGLGGLFLFLSL